MLKSRRRNYRQGGSLVMTLPAALELGRESTLAGNRVLLVDPRGQIPEADLLEFMERFVEPELWPFLKKKAAKRSR